MAERKVGDTGSCTPGVLHTSWPAEWVGSEHVGAGSMPSDWGTPLLGSQVTLTRGWGEALSNCPVLLDGLLIR